MQISSGNSNAKIRVKTCFHFVFENEVLIFLIFIPDFLNMFCFFTEGFQQN